ncbi:aldehyde dehydrogenase, partial [Streptomyces radicis]
AADTLKRIHHPHPHEDFTTTPTTTRLTTHLETKTIWHTTGQ